VEFRAAASDDQLLPSTHFTTPAPPRRQQYRWRSSNRVSPHAPSASNATSKRLTPLRLTQQAPPVTTLLAMPMTNAVVTNLSQTPAVPMFQLRRNDPSLFSFAIASFHNQRTDPLIEFVRLMSLAGSVGIHGKRLLASGQIEQLSKLSY